MIRTPILIDTYDEPRTDSAPQLGAHNAELLPKVSPTTAAAEERLCEFIRMNLGKLIDRRGAVFPN